MSFRIWFRNFIIRRLKVILAYIFFSVVIVVGICHENLSTIFGGSGVGLAYPLLKNFDIFRRGR
jgi:uncharacterized membrane protein